MNTLLRLLKLMRPYAGWMLLGILASFITLVANVALMAISGWFIAAMAIAGAAGLSMNYFTPAAIIRGTAILRTAGRYAERLLTHEATFRLLASLRVWFYRHLEPLAPAGLERYRSGDLMSRIGADIDALNQLYLRVLVPVSVAVLGVTLLTWVMAGYDRLLAAVLLALLLTAGVALPWWTGRLGRQPGEQQVQRSAALRTVVVDGVQGMAELNLYGADRAQATRVADQSRALIDAQARSSRIAGLAQSGLMLCANLALWLVVIIAVPLVGQGHLQPAELAMLALFTLAAFEAVMPLPDAFRMLGQTLAAARRLFAIVDQSPPMSDPETGRKAPGALDFRFQSVSLNYPGQATPALRHIDLDLSDGARIAVTGPTGSGKSSLIPLLLRFREPTTGKITLAGHDLAEYRGADLRDWIAVVPQQVQLFNASIADNLRLAAPDADQPRLEQACRIAQLHQFIQSQPDGYATWVGETGVRLSGGQARRLAIARALLRDFRLLVLDEPGEGLDAATEQALMTSLFDALGDRGLLLITHRRAGLDRVDYRLRLEQGRCLGKEQTQSEGE